jgi:hypothetical protein
MTTPSGGGPAAPSDADLIREQLTALNLSQREAARDLGIDDRTMRYYCAGKAPVPPVVFLALRELKQIQLNARCLELLGDGTMSASDGDHTAERLRKANHTLRAAIEILLRPVRDARNALQGRPVGNSESPASSGAVGKPVSVEIRERGTFRLVATYDIDAASPQEPPTRKKYGDEAWAQAVTAGRVDPLRRSDYDVIVPLVTLGYGPDTDLWPMTLHQSAQSFAAVADAAVRQLGRLNDSSSLYLAVLFLLAQAIELALKAFLRFGGYSKDQLVDLGHDLARLVYKARDLGLAKPHHPADVRLLELLNDTYLKQRKLQFQRASDIRLPFLRPIRELAAEYICSFPLARTSPASTIDGAADYGEPSLADFRTGARGTDLRSARLEPQESPAERRQRAGDDSAPASSAMTAKIATILDPGVASRVVQEIRAKYAPWFTVADEAHRLAAKVLPQLQPPADDNTRLLAALLFGRLLTSFESAYLLTEQGLCGDARTVLRAMVESTIFLGAVVTDPKVIDLLVTRHIVNEWKLVAAWLADPQAVESTSPENLERLNAKLTENRADNPEVKRDPIDVQELAKSSNLLWLYNTAFRVLSGDAAHTSVLALERHVKTDAAGKIIALRFGADETEVPDTLSIAMPALLNATHTAIHLFDLGHYKAELDRHLSAWQALPGSAEPPNA